MGKPYINNAVIGNGSMLGCISETGELIRLYWPEIDHPQHIEKMLTGFFDANIPNSTMWFSEGDHETTQDYIEDTNILRTTVNISKLSLQVAQTDFCIPDKHVLVRHYSVKNIGANSSNIKMGLASHTISHTFDLGNTMFDFGTDTLIHYKHDNYWAIASELEVKQFQIGSNPFGALWDGYLNGIDSIGMSPDGALLWDLGTISPGQEKCITIYLVFSRSMDSLKNTIKEAKGTEFQKLLSITKQYWLDFFKKIVNIDVGDEITSRIYRRSLLLFKLMSDKNTGGLLASPEIDEGFTQCGRYAYCWGRDAAFIASALDEVGLFEETERFYDWVIKVQDSEGFWHQRYNMNGNLAPSWGIQIDETGTILFGIWQHFLHVRSKSFLEKVWPTVLKAIKFLEGFIDEDTGLPLPSFDLWEERMGEHTYSTAAVIAGFNAAADIGEQLGVKKQKIYHWRTIADNMKKSLEKTLIDNQNETFLRSVRVKLNPWGNEPSSNTVVINVNSKGYSREVSMVDDKIDISLLGTVVPFNIYEPEDTVVRNTVKKIEDTLLCSNVGGIYRYEGDDYAGGNPWIVSTLWLALYYIRLGDITKAREYFNWSIKSATSLGFLPEQVCKHSGKPCWVIPLTWSHAMYVLVLKGLMEHE
ncbi:MAG TPA: glycoside hydrolase family 15 protein [Thermoclostridium sp.]|nr:glycoside hydrolase family 15 protein [Thermoclostridium sp.]